MRLDCRDRRLRTRPGLLLLIAFFVTCTFTPVASFGQEHAPQHPPAAHGAQAQRAEAGAEHDQEHEAGGILPLVAKVANFAILVGILVYFLKSPIVAFLASRITTVKQDLSTAWEMREAAEAQLMEIDRKLKALPAELEALKKQGAEDVRAEQARIAQAAAAERERLLEQTRREIEMRLRIARRELTAHAAELAVGVARQRISRAITTEDQLRMLDRYIMQLQETR